MRPLIASLLFCWVLVFARAESISVDLEWNYFNGYPTTKVSASTGGFSDSPNDYRGRVLAQVSFDSDTLIPETIKFTGGEILERSTRYNFSSDVNFIGFGTFETEFTLNLNNIKFQFLTPGPPGSIDPVTNELNNEDHIQRAYSGTYSFQIEGNGGTIVETLDFAAEPEEVMLSGTNTLEISEVGQELLTRTIRFDLTTELDESGDVPFAGTNLTLTVTEKGALTGATGVVIPTDFVNWAKEHQVDIEYEAQANQNDVPYALLYAFNLPIDSNYNDVPIRLVSDREGPYLEITPPPTGLQFRLEPRNTENNRWGSWYQVEEQYIFPDLSALQRGSTTKSKVFFSGPYPQFIKVCVAPDDLD